MIVAVGKDRVEAKKMRKFGQTVLNFLVQKLVKNPERMSSRLMKGRDDFDYLDIQAAMQDAKLEAPKVVKTRNGFQVMVYSRKVKKFIPQGQPHKTKAAAEKDAKMFEECQRASSCSEEEDRKAKPSLPAYDARLLRQALVLGKMHSRQAKKREPIKRSEPCETKRSQHEAKGADEMISRLRRLRKQPKWDSKI